MEFHWADYLIFSLSLTMGVIIGFITYFTGGKQQTSRAYFQGGGNMNAIAVGASRVTSFMNAIFLLGGVAEVYYRGAIYCLRGLYVVPMTLVVSLFFVHKWKKVNVLSAYEYLEQRFHSRGLRIWSAFLFSVEKIVFMAVVFYTPAMALSQVTGLSMHIAVFTCGIVCALYTVVGGMSAVVWTDAAQAILMILGLLVLCIMGSTAAGGPQYIYQQAYTLGRINFNNFNFDPRERHTVWSLIIGYSVLGCLHQLADQIVVQRYMAVKDVKAVQKSVVVHSIISSINLILVTCIGVIASVFYKDCDPLLSGKIKKADQLLPYFFLDILGSYPGLPGLFISSIFAAALSTVSSSVNSLTAVFLMDFLKPFMEFISRPIKKDHETIYAKILSVCFALLSIAMSYLAPFFGNAIIQIPPTLNAVISSSLFSIFFLGFYVPWANKWTIAQGAFVGSILGLGINIWLSIGALLYQKPLSTLTLGTCMSSNSSSDVGMVVMSSSNSTSVPLQTNRLQNLYDLSYLWIGIIGVSVSIILGLIISFVTNRCGLGQTFAVDNTDISQKSESIEHSNYRQSACDSDKAVTLRVLPSTKDGDMDDIILASTPLK